jgi:predicted nucleic acid-binding protein
MSFMSEPSSRQFVDTNILVYAHDISAGQKQLRARQLLEELWESGQGCVSIQVLQEFYVTVTRKIAKPLPAEIAAQIVADLSSWEVHCPRANDILEAIHIQQRFQVSFWDASVIASAVALGCQVIWSEDLSPGQAYHQVQVQNPF